MSRLKETNFQGIPGWQWDDGPIFVGEEARKHAVGYGKAVQCLEEWKAYAKLCQEHEISMERLATLELQKAIRDGVEDGTFRFHWHDGKVEDGLGKTVNDAFTRLGYGAGAMPALDYYEEVK